MTAPTANLPKSRSKWVLSSALLILVLVIIAIISQREPHTLTSRFADESSGTTTPLFVVRVNNLKGFMDRSGRLIIPATFENVYPFRGGLAPASANGKWGYINESGEWVIEPQFAMAGFFNDGLADARTSFDKPYGYIDRKGMFVIQPQFDAAGPFIDGFAQVGNETWMSKLNPADVGLECDYFYIDKTGQLVDPSSVASGSGRQPVPDSELRPFKADGKMGFVNESGQVAVPAKYDYVYEFENGLAKFTVDGGKKSGYIDESGRVVWEASR